MGSRTRLLRFDPGVYTTAPFVHDHWEEVYLVSGDLIVGNDTEGKGGEAFEAPTYACRPPGVYHGPFKSDRGCLLYEFTITTRASTPSGDSLSDLSSITYLVHASPSRYREAAGKLLDEPLGAFWPAGAWR